MLVVAAGIGYLAVAQLGSTERFSQKLQAESEGDLTRILSDLTTTDAELRDQIGALKLQLQTLSTSSERDEAASRAAEEQLNDLAVRAGTAAVTGTGITVTVSDPQASIQYDLMIDLVEELRDAGAEAIAVNNLRVGAASWFGAGAGAGGLAGRVPAAPFKGAAIGQPATLDGGLAIPGGALDSFRTQKGVAIEV